MELEKQVVSLDLANRLKELGVKQESLFWWVNQPNGGLQTNGYKWQLELEPRTRHQSYNYLSAFTVAELLQMLKEPVLVPVDGSAADYLAGLIINMHQNGKGVSRR